MLAGNGESRSDPGRSPGHVQVTTALLSVPQFFTCLVILFACEVAAGILGYMHRETVSLRRAGPSYTTMFSNPKERETKTFCLL